MEFRRQCFWCNQYVKVWKLSRGSKTVVFSIDSGQLELCNRAVIMPTECRLSLFQCNYSREEEKLNRKNDDFIRFQSKNIFLILIYLFFYFVVKKKPQQQRGHRHKYVYEMSLSKNEKQFCWWRNKSNLYPSHEWNMKNAIAFSRTRTAGYWHHDQHTHSKMRWKKKSECKYASWLVISCGANKLINGDNSKCFLLNSYHCLVHSLIFCHYLNWICCRLIRRRRRRHRLGQFHSTCEMWVAALCIPNKINMTIIK